MLVYTNPTGALEPVKGLDGAIKVTITGGDQSSDQWEDSSYVMDSNGNITSETQRKASTPTTTRSRSWTYTTDQNGNITATAGAWA